jgi:hypothetical protein
MSSSNPTESNNAAVSSPTERRRNLRFQFSATVEATENKSGTKIVGRTSDLGLGGCYVDTLSPFPVGTEAKIRIVRDNESFEAQVRVVYSLIGMGMGLAFVSAQPKQVRLFQKWVMEISGQSAPAQDSPAQEASESEPVEETPTFKNFVLSDLIMILMKKNVITEAEGKVLLRKLFK